MEHDLNIDHPIKFILLIVLMGSIGVLMGGFVEYFVTKIPRDDNQAQCGGLLVLQLTIIATIILLATRISKTNLFSLLNTDWKGRLFLLTFFVAQGSIALNIQCLFKLSY